MNIFPLISLPASDLGTELPLAREVRWDFTKDEPVWHGGNPATVTGSEAVLVWAWNTLNTSRYHERRTEPITSGNANHYVMWAKEVTGVSYARCIPLWNGNGTVKVIIAGADKKPLDDTIVTACAEHIEAERPIGAMVTVVSVTEVEIPIVAKIKLVNAHSLDEVKADLSTAVSALLAALPFAEEQSVPYSRFLACLLQCAGVADYSTFTVNGAKTALRINSGTIPVLGTVDVTTY